RPLADRWPFSRMAGMALLQLPDQSRLLVIALHLHPRHERIRQEEAALVREQLEAWLPAADHAVVLGDFNCVPQEQIHADVLARGFVNALAAAGNSQPTYDTTGAKTFSIDHIYLSRSLAPRLTRAYTLRAPGFWHDGPLPPGAWLHSDHLPVIAELSWTA
ncbi:MAG: endonuclease/exonuclease/phosphatase family protein, partial [Anaerolineae bacterium]